MCIECILTGCNFLRPAEELLVKDTEMEMSSHAHKRTRREGGHEDEESQRALSSIFGMSSDDEEEISSELMVSRIPETQEEPSQVINEA